MKSFIAACVAILVIGVGAHFVLENAGFSSAEVQSRAASVSLD